MSARIKVVCSSSLRVGCGEGDVRENILTGDGGVILKLSGQYELGFEFENGREYYVDFCKVIALRTPYGVGEVDSDQVQPKLAGGWDMSNDPPGKVVKRRAVKCAPTVPYHECKHEPKCYCEPDPGF
jgi:hypothetical protein